MVSELPADIQRPIREIALWLREDLRVSHKDFSELNAAVERLAEAQEKLAEAQVRTEQRVEQLAEAQARTEQKVEQLAEAQARTEQRVEQLAEAQARTEQRVEQLAEAQARTEQRVEQLAEAQARTEQRVEQLAEAQARTEQKVERLAEAQEKLAEAQARTEQKVERLADGQEKLAEAQARTEREIGKLRKTLSDQITGLGSRWGLYNEGTFRSTIYGIFSRMDGVTVKEGWYGGRQVDVVIRNGEHILLEITSRMHSRDIDKLYRSADDYETQTGVRPTLMVATSYVSPRLMQTIMNLERPIDIFSYEGEE